MGHGHKKSSYLALVFPFDLFENLYVNSSPSLPISLPFTPIFASSSFTLVFFFTLFDDLRVITHNKLRHERIYKCKLCVTYASLS